jgi:hypothetical protein
LFAFNTSAIKAPKFSSPPTPAPPLLLLLLLLRFILLVPLQLPFLPLLAILCGAT